VLRTIEMLSQETNARVTGGAYDVSDAEAAKALAKHAIDTSPTQRVDWWINAIALGQGVEANASEAAQAERGAAGFGVAAADGKDSDEAGEGGEEKEKKKKKKEEEEEEEEEEDGDNEHEHGVDQEEQRRQQRQQTIGDPPATLEGAHDAERQSSKSNSALGATKGTAIYALSVACYAAAQAMKQSTEGDIFNICVQQASESLEARAHRRAVEALSNGLAIDLDSSQSAVYTLCIGGGAAARAILSWPRRFLTPLRERRGGTLGVRANPPAPRGAHAQPVLRARARLWRNTAH
jgi:hypothetical protein